MSVSRTTGGWMLLVASTGMMLSFVSADLKDVGQWAEVSTPQMVGQFLQHLSVVIGAFVAGQIVPTMGTDRKDP